MRPPLVNRVRVYLLLIERSAENGLFVDRVPGGRAVSHRSGKAFWWGPLRVVYDFIVGSYRCWAHRLELLNKIPCQL